jgi:Protein kinase domain
VRLIVDFLQYPGRMSVQVFPRRDKGRSFRASDFPEFVISDSVLHCPMLPVVMLSGLARTSVNIVGHTLIGEGATEWRRAAADYFAAKELEHEVETIVVAMHEAAKVQDYAAAARLQEHADSQRKRARQLIEQSGASLARFTIWNRSDEPAPGSENRHLEQSDDSSVDTSVRERRYSGEVGAVIGQGAQGSVLELRRPSGEVCALKQMSSRREFEREVSILVSCSHPNICRVLDSGRFNGEYWFTMERFSCDLESFLAERYDASKTGTKYLSGPDVTEIFTSIASALCYLHHKGTSHRDLKSKKYASLSFFRVI